MLRTWADSTGEVHLVPVELLDRVAAMETLLDEKTRCQCGDDEACALVRRVAELEAEAREQFKFTASLAQKLDAIRSILNQI
jgi:hypothetical protein